MLLAHLVPGYFASAKSQPVWQPAWSRTRRLALWAVALFSTFAPDLDVIYNGLFRGFFNHSTLWAHSIFVHGGIVLGWLALKVTRRWEYLQMLVGLAAFGGVSHLVLDLIAHGEILLYPVSMHVFVAEFSRRALEGGLWGYITSPVFLLEPLLFALAAAHWVSQRKISARAKNSIFAALIAGYSLFAVAFLANLAALQNLVEPLMR